MKKIKTYPNHLEIITSVLIKILMSQDIMNAFQMLEHHRKDIISVNAVEFKKDNGSFHIRSYNLMDH